ncbi:radical SAM protein [Priestia megaterium]|uniref:radical SAM protein n=1 Tax=Priestia megaterium TaxID=1404 RepID=UPI00189DB7F1|nr:radical SAM protein [Priestia megaterium]
MIKYLFVRILESCNAGCWFCGFAHSRDKFRLSTDEFKNILDEADLAGVEYIRFTGGETLLHRELTEFVRMCKKKGIKTSIITNGFLLEKKIIELYEAGLDQVTVSIDEVEHVHDEIRKLPNLFDRATRGIKKAKELGVKVRVNTVCGPHNYKSMPILQDIFTELGVTYWELSALKLDSKIEYEADGDIEKVISSIYDDSGNKSKLIPYGKKWCGNTEQEQKEYFEQSIPPRPSDKCHMVNLVRYYDAKNRNLYVCSLLAHRGLEQKYYRSFSDDERFSLTDKQTSLISEYFYHNGPSVCTGCSSTAAGCSDEYNKNNNFYEWMY